MKFLLAAIATAISTTAAATTATQPSKVVRGEAQTQYNFEIDQDKLAPLVVVVPDTTVPLQQIIVVTKKDDEKPVTVVPVPAAELALPGGVKNAKEAMSSWPFAAALEKANSVLEVPETVKLGKSMEARLIVDQVVGATAEKLDDKSAVQITHVVVTKILAPDFDIIEVINDGRQVLNPGGTTEWRWTLTPRKIGEYKINVTMSAVIEIGHDRAERLIKVFDHEVTVFVTPADAVKYFFSKNWQWLWSTLILPFGIWIWKSKRKKKSIISTDTESEA